MPVLPFLVAKLVIGYLCLKNNFKKQPIFSKIEKKYLKKDYIFTNVGN